VAIFLGEAVALALFGGIAGYLAGVRLAQFMSRAVFDSSLQLSSWLLAISLVSALVVALLGSIPPVRRGLLVEPIRGLKG
jgi:putative ABC transport system permease protein